MLDIKIRKAVEAVQNTLHERCHQMEPESYMRVLVQLAADIDANIECLKEENPDVEFDQ